MKNISLSIPDMQSVHCQVRVTNSIKDIEGVSIERVEAGNLSFTVTNEQSTMIVINAIEQAGYPVKNMENDETKNDAPSCCTTK